MIKIVARSSISIIAVFILISVIAFSSLKISFLSFIGNDADRTESFLYFMSLENRALHSILPPRTDMSFSKDALALLTNINLRDMKSFLISEIPGLDAASPKILIAGEGTDFTNLPIESPPPDDYGVVEEEEAVQDEEKADEKIMQTTDHVAFIFHTHNRESFLPLLPQAKEANQAFSKDKNITQLGQRLGQKLEEKGIKTMVDTSDIQGILKKRDMQYFQSYAVSREVVVEALQKNKEVQLVFDLHRDAARKNVTTTTINGIDYARSYFVIGTGHPSFAKNLKLAEKLHYMIEKKYEGLSRGVFEKERSRSNNGIYNQDLSANTLLIEIGGVDNTLDELNRTVDILAEVISEYYWEDSVEVSK